MKKDKIVVAVSGGFDPLHVGHVEMFKEARELGDILVVILNNDNWINKKKGHVFMPEDERAAIIAVMEMVDEVVLTDHKKDPEDMSVASTLRKVKPNIFANGGDRTGVTTKEAERETEACIEISCESVFNIGKSGKIQSSSWLLENHLEKHKDD